GAEVAVTGEQYQVIDRACNFHRVDGELDIHAAFDLAPASLIDEFLCRLGHDAVAIVIKPIDQGPDRRVLLVLDYGGIIKRAQEKAARLKIAQQTPVIDIKNERLGGGVGGGGVNEQSDFFRFGFHDCSRARSFNVGTLLRARAPTG